MNRPVEALEAYELNLKLRPNRFNGLYGAALSAKDAGDKMKSIMYFKMLIDQTGSSNSQRPEIREAIDYIENN